MVFEHDLLLDPCIVRWPVFGRLTRMPRATTDDDVRLSYEEAGSGEPLVFVHEFAGDARSWGWARRRDAAYRSADVEPGGR